MTDLIVKEVAEVEFDRFVESMDLDVDTTAMDEEDKKSFDQQKSRIVKAIQTGAIIINDGGEPSFTPQRSKNVEPITFYEPTGATLMAMDRKKKTEDVGKLYAAMGDMTKQAPKVFSSMAMGDLKVCTAIATLFLG